MAELDKRLLPARGDIAARHLEGVVEAQAFVDGTQMQVSRSALAIRRTPDPQGAQETQALFGEIFTVYDSQNGWAWGQAEFDDYVGYVRLDGLSENIFPVTHRVAALRTYLFTASDLKSPPLELLSMNARLCLTKDEGPYRQDARGGWVWAGHTVTIDTSAPDPVGVAERFLGAPYFWGGRESLGLDCSGLIQNAWAAIGHTVPRDADLQEAHFADSEHGLALWDSASEQPWTDIALRRGDLIFWPGHVGVMTDSTRMLHANATHMETSLDSLRDIADRWQQEKDLRVRHILRPHL